MLVVESMPGAGSGTPTGSVASAVAAVVSPTVASLMVAKDWKKIYFLLAITDFAIGVILLGRSNCEIDVGAKKLGAKTKPRRFCAKKNGRRAEFKTS